MLKKRRKIGANSFFVEVFIKIDKNKFG